MQKIAELLARPQRLWHSLQPLWRRERPFPLLGEMQIFCKNFLAIFPMVMGRTKIARFSAAAAAIFAAPPKNRDFSRPQDARFPLRRKSLANCDFFCEENFPPFFGDLHPGGVPRPPRGKQFARLECNERSQKAPFGGTRITQKNSCQQVLCNRCPVQWRH